MIEIFKTNVQETAASHLIVRRLLEYFPFGQITFDLEDCDKVLRVEDTAVCNNTVKSILAVFGYRCEEME